MKSVDLEVLQRLHVDPWAAVLGAYGEHLMWDGARCEMRRYSNRRDCAESSSDIVTLTDKARQGKARYGMANHLRDNGRLHALHIRGPVLVLLSELVVERTAQVRKLRAQPSVLSHITTNVTFTSRTLLTASALWI